MAAAVASRARRRLEAGFAATTPRQGAAILAVVAGVAAVVLAHEVFSYLSYNHDEAVYLQQAAMLLDGRLAVSPPGGRSALASLRPWFFVVDGQQFYPKYSPVPAGMFAVGALLGGFRIALGLIAAAVVALAYATVAEAFDRRTGLVAAALLVATPLFVVQSAVFLPYVPTLAWLLLFAWAYLRADRTGDLRWAALAGVGVGVAFFARPYTAVLFAAPFVAHALWTLHRDGLGAVRRRAVPSVLRRQGATAALGLLGVAVALGYNALVTGDPLVFPYEAFSAQDGPGFGWRELWGHGLEYTPELAIESTRIALTAYVLEWSAAPPVGVGLAAVGGWLVARRGRRADPRRLALGGLVVTVIAGHLYFWGTLNAIGNLDQPGFGLMGHLGPYYHLALVVPTVAFGAHALVVGYDRLRPRIAGPDGARARAGVAAAVVVLAAVAGATAVAGVGSALQDNREVTEAYETAYEPVESADLDRALVFLPTPHGPWLAHPFQHLHNDPGFDGPVVYAQDRAVFDVLAAFPERTPYRYTYRGEWLPVGGRSVDPRLQSLDHVRSEAVRLDATLGVPAATGGAVVHVETAAGQASTDLIVPEGETLTVTATVANGTAAGTGAADGIRTADGTGAADGIRTADGTGASGANWTAVVGSPGSNESVTVPVADRDALNLTVFVDAGGLDSFEYDLTLPVQRENGTVAAVTPRQRVCTDVRRCDDGGAYVPGSHRPGVSVETDLAVETDLSVVETGAVGRD